MSLISATNLSKSYGPEDIFSSVSFSIPHDARVAIVGPNGIGKTTLLRILVGIEEPTAGKYQLGHEFVSRVGQQWLGKGRPKNEGQCHHRGWFLHATQHPQR